jgi:hypothetical protein
MNDIAGIPYEAAIFDKDGAALNKQEVKLPDGTTDVIVASHGWNNNQEQAEQFYTDLFTNFAVVASDQLRIKRSQLRGVIWPSKKFTDVVDAAVAEQARGGGAGFATELHRGGRNHQGQARRHCDNVRQERRRKRSPLRRTRLASWRVISMHGENL